MAESVTSSHVYARVSSRKSKTGQVVRYLQLAHNEWDPAAGMSRTKVLYSFGREDELDRPAVQRLVTALSRLLDPAAAAALTTPADMTLTDSRPIGGAYALDGLWRRLGVDTAIRAALADKRVDAARVERILFALTANRALKPSSKLAATDWIAHDVHIDGLTDVVDEACYRAMDALLAVEAVVARQVYHQVADLLNLEVDLLFFDTTSTYFETGEADTPIARDEHGRVRPGVEPSDLVRDSGFRTRGKSKDHRDDLPQVVVGMAVTRTGIPVRVWSWPGNYRSVIVLSGSQDALLRPSPLRTGLASFPRIRLKQALWRACWQKRRCASGGVVPSGAVGVHQTAGGVVRRVPGCGDRGAADRLS